MVGLLGKLLPKVEAASWRLKRKLEEAATATSAETALPLSEVSIQPVRIGGMLVALIFNGSSQETFSHLLPAARADGPSTTANPVLSSCESETWTTIRYPWTFGEFSEWRRPLG
jgi:hypothetical protein